MYYQKWKQNLANNQKVKKKHVSHKYIVGEICSDEKNEAPDDETENMVRDDGEDDTESESGDEFKLDDSEWIMC